MTRRSDPLLVRVLHRMRANRLALVCCIAIGGCAPPLLAPDDRGHVCRVAVDENFGFPALQPNPLSTPGGPVTGAAGGALAGLIYGMGPQAILTVPLGAVIGAVGGAACAAAGASHPDAEAHFERILRVANAAVLKHALEADLNVPRAGCGPAPADASAAATPDTMVEIEKVDIMMGCAFGKQEYWVAVKWRVIDAASRRVLGAKTTPCRLRSYRYVDDWFADPDLARAEIERVLTRTGQRMAAEVLAPWGLPECTFHSGPSGEVE